MSKKVIINSPIVSGMPVEAEFYCPNCGIKIETADRGAVKYCPNCGAAIGVKIEIE